MSNPSFENIDQWLFEYTEGNLSPSQVTQLERFLLNNPELEADLDAWQLAKADASPVVFPGIPGRSRKPVPAWLFPTIALTATFAVGTLFGSILTSQWQENEVEIASVAQAPIHKTFSSVKRIASIEDVNLNSTEEFVPQLAERNGVSSFSRNSIVANIAEVNQTSSASVQNNSQDQQVLQPSVFETTENQEMSNSHETDLTQSETKIVSSTPNVVIEENKEVIDGNSEIGFKENAKNTSVTEEISNPDVKASDEKNGNTSIDPAQTAKAMTRGTERISSNYEKSFASTMKSTWRKVIRMTENPIALTNSKDIYYHVPGMQTLNVNFATAGNLLTPRVQSISRAQWTGHSNQQLMNELSFDTYVKSIRGGIGVQMNHAYYNLGTYNLGQIALTYSPKFTVKRNFSIEPAIRFKMGDRRLNASNLVQGQVIEMDRGNEHIFYNETPENLVKDLWYKDIGVGINSNTKWFSFGFQADNLGRHFDNAYNSSGKFDRAGIHYTTTLGTDFISRSKIFSLSTYIMYQKVENLSEIWGGSIFRYKMLTVGGGISSSGDYAASIGVKTNRFMLTYNADNTCSFLAEKRLFSQQLTIRILMKNGYNGRTLLKQ